MSKVRSALGYAVHSHGCVSLNIIWRWPRSSTVDSSPSHTPWSPPTPFDASLIQRPCDYVSVPAPPRSRDHSTSLLRMYSLLFSFLFTSLNFLSFLPLPRPPSSSPSSLLTFSSFAPGAFYSLSLEEEKPSEKRPLILLSFLLLLRLFQSYQPTMIGRLACELLSFVCLTLVLLEVLWWNFGDSVSNVQ